MLLGRGPADGFGYGTGSAYGSDYPDGSGFGFDDGSVPGKRYSGVRGFKLYDTFGMPLDFIQDAVRDAGLAFDQAGFDRAMAEQRERARASWKGSAKKTASPAY